jgi:hypothetical protein
MCVHHKQNDWHIWVSILLEKTNVNHSSRRYMIVMPCAPWLPFCILIDWLYACSIAGISRPCFCTILFGSYSEINVANELLHEGNVGDMARWMFQYREDWSNKQHINLRSNTQNDAPPMSELNPASSDWNYTTPCTYRTVQLMPILLFRATIQPNKTSQGLHTLFRYLVQFGICVLRC